MFNIFWWAYAVRHVISRLFGLGTLQLNSSYDFLGDVAAGGGGRGLSSGGSVCCLASKRFTRRHDLQAARRMRETGGEGYGGSSLGHQSFSRRGVGWREEAGKGGRQRG